MSKVGETEMMTNLTRKARLKKTITRNLQVGWVKMWAAEYDDSIVIVRKRSKKRAREW